jgi:hypothetical protein
VNQPSGTPWSMTRMKSLSSRQFPAGERLHRSASDQHVVLGALMVPIFD